ncbi:MAG: hypothetical protein AAFR61_24180 [Bacteroidota bacterium]
MPILYLIAALFCFLLGLVHSLLGERLIFRKKRAQGQLVPTLGKPGLAEAHLRIIWATWHLASVLGWGIGVILLQLYLHSSEVPAEILGWTKGAIGLSMGLGGLLVGYGTKGRHPGWMVLGLIALLSWLA